MRRERFLSCLISVLVGGAVGAFAGYTLAERPAAPDEEGLSREARSLFGSLALAVNEYRQEEGCLPSDLRSLYPRYYLPFSPESLEQHRSSRPGRPDFVYVPIKSADAAVLVAGHLYRVFTPPEPRNQATGEDR